MSGSIPCRAHADLTCEFSSDISTELDSLLEGFVNLRSSEFQLSSLLHLTTATRLYTALQVWAPSSR